MDLYLVHAPDPHVPIRETMAALEALWKEGKIGGIGVSNFSAGELEEAQRGLSETSILVDQVRYNLFDRADGDPIREYLSLPRHLDRSLHSARSRAAHRPLPGWEGPLAGSAAVGARSLRARTRSPEVLRRAQALRGLAEEAGVSMTSIALHWLRSKGAAPLCGASRPEQVDATHGAWHQVPSANVIERAEAIAAGTHD